MALALETERMVLRPFTVEDVELLVDLDADPEVMRHLTGGAATPRTTIVDEVLPRFRSWDDRDPFGYAAAFERRTESFVGWFALDPADRSRPAHVELGYRLRRAAWGHGYATEAACTLVDRAFDHPAVQRVWAQTMAVNRRSRRVMERAGLRYARTFHQQWFEAIAGAEAGEVEYQLTRAEWASR